MADVATVDAVGSDRAEVDPGTWVRTTVGVSPIPFRNTLRDALPADRKDVGGNYMGQWPGSAYFAEAREVALYNGGHQTFNMPGVAYASLKTLTWTLRNRSDAIKREAEMPRTGLPDADGDHKTFHGYNGHVAWGDRLVMFTFYRDERDVPNPVAYYDRTRALHGGGAFYTGRNRYFRNIGGFATAAVSRAPAGIFVGDKAQSGAETFAFLPGDDHGGLADPDFSWPNPIVQWADSVLTVDDDDRILITTNRDFDSGRVYLNVVDLDASRATYKTMTRVPVSLPPGFDPKPFEPGRAGVTWLRGKGLVGAYKLPTGETVGVQIRLGADRMADPATLSVVFRDLPSLENGYFGALQPIHDLGITFSPTSATSDPIQIFWPPA